MGHPSALKVVLVMMAILVGVIASLVTGILARAAGAPMTTAVLRGGVAFSGAVPLVLLIMSTLGIL